MMYRFSSYDIFFYLSQSSFKYSFWDAFEKCAKMFFYILHTNTHFFLLQAHQLFQRLFRWPGVKRKNNNDRTIVPRRTSEGAERLKYLMGIQIVPVKIFRIWESYEKGGEEGFYFHIFSLVALNFQKSKKHQTKWKTPYQSWQARMNIL